MACVNENQCNFDIVIGSPGGKINATATAIPLSSVLMQICTQDQI